MEGADKKDKAKMAEISLKYRVLCSETSFMAVEKLKTKVEGEMKPMVIPIAITKDSEPEMSHGISTSRLMFKGASSGMKRKKARGAPATTTLGAPRMML